MQRSERRHRGGDQLRPEVDASSSSTARHLCRRSSPQKQRGQWNHNRNPYFFFQENTFENIVCKMAAKGIGKSVWVNFGQNASPTNADELTTTGSMLANMKYNTFSSTCTIIFVKVLILCYPVPIETSTAIHWNRYAWHRWLMIILRCCAEHLYLHDGVIKWKHFQRYRPLRGESTGHRCIPLKSQWRGALMFSLICAWTNGWANNRGAGYLRRPKYTTIVRTRTKLYSWL